MAKKSLLPKNNARGARTYLIFSFVVAFGLGGIWFAGTRKLEDALIAAGLAFVVTIVVVATLALTVKDEQPDPDQPRLG